MLTRSHGTALCRLVASLPWPTKYVIAPIHSFRLGRILISEPACRRKRNGDDDDLDICTHPCLAPDGSRADGDHLCCRHIALIRHCRNRSHVLLLCLIVITRLDQDHATRYFIRGAPPQSLR